MEYAKMLYLDTSQNLTIQEIAERVSVRPNTVSNWIKKEGWDKLRKSLMVTRQKMISDLYDQLDFLNTNIKTRKVVYDVPDKYLKGTKVKDKDGNETIQYPSYDETQFPIKVGNYATPQEANTISVISSSIKKLETETSIAEIYEVATGFCEFVKPQDFALYKKLVNLFDIFINSKLK